MIRLNQFIRGIWCIHLIVIEIQFLFWKNFNFLNILLGNGGEICVVWIHIFTFVFYIIIIISIHKEWLRYRIFRWWIIICGMLSWRMSNLVLLILIRCPFLLDNIIRSSIINKFLLLRLLIVWLCLESLRVIKIRRCLSCSFIRNFI